MQQLPRMLRVAVSLSLTAALITPMGALSAQDASRVATSAQHDARWQPWLGCWSPTGAVSSAVAATMLCVVPGPTPTSVEILNFSGGAVTDRTVIDPGQAVAKQADECKGSETASWSADGRRLMLRGTFTCARGVTRSETGLMSISADGEWVQAQSINIGSLPPTFYVAHFRDTEMQIEGVRGDTIIERPVLDLAGHRTSPPRFGCTGTETVTRDTAQRVVVRSAYACAGGLLRVADAKFERVNGDWVRTDREPVPFGTPSVRAEAGAPVTTEDVLEVARAVDPAVAEAWITERGQTFALTGKQLVSLADRGMPSRVIDMLVAISNPATFTMQRNDARMSVSELAALENTRRGEPAQTYTTTTYSYGMTGIGWMYSADYYNLWNPYNRNGYYGNQYGYGNYGGYYNRGNGPPVIVVGPPVTPQPRGRAVYGQGYTRSQPSSAGSDVWSRSSRSSGSDASVSGSERGRSSGTARSAPSTSGSSSGPTGGSSSGSSSGESTGRTAKARGGGN